MPPALKAWRTTAMGVCILGVKLYQAHAHPGTIDDPAFLVGVLAGVGMIFAGDASQPPSPPPLLTTP